MKSKIIISFSITIFLILLLGATSILKMQELAGLSEKLYNHPLSPTNINELLQIEVFSHN